MSACGKSQQVNIVKVLMQSGLSADSACRMRIYRAKMTMLPGASSRDVWVTRTGPSGVRCFTRDVNSMSSTAG